MKENKKQSLDQEKPQDIYRVEIANHRGNFDLLGIEYEFDKAMARAQRHDDYYVRILDCVNNRVVVWSNFKKLRLN